LIWGRKGITIILFGIFIVCAISMATLSKKGRSSGIALQGEKIRSGLAIRTKQILALPDKPAHARETVDQKIEHLVRELSALEDDVLMWRSMVEQAVDGQSQKVARKNYDESVQRMEDVRSELAYLQEKKTKERP